MPDQADSPNPSSAGRERRRYPRLAGLELTAMIGGKLVKVVEVSATGMTVEKLFAVTAEPMRFTLYPSAGTKLELNHGVPGVGVAIHEEEHLVGLRFAPATMALVKLIASRTR